MAVTIKYDGNTGPSGNTITYTDIPNILTIGEAASSSAASITLRITNRIESPQDGEFYITVLDETITNVSDPKNAVSKNFYISTNSDASVARKTTAASICKALRNCSTIAANFTVENVDNVVILIAREKGPILPETGVVSTNLSPQNFSYTALDGSTTSSLYGSKISVDVLNHNNDYITTLEKNYYGNEVSFNMSPVLATITEIGKSFAYKFRISMFSRNGIYSVIDTVPINYSVVGYMVNQGYKYNIAKDNTVIAQNMKRGENRDVFNNSLLYVYEPTIPISFYTLASTTKTVNVTYRDSSFNAISSFSSGFTPHGDSNVLNDVTIELNPTYFKQAFYIDVQFPDIDDAYKVIRYNVIKPLKMTEYCQRIYFRNSYGGISFFDFTGQKSETRDLDLMTYEKNIFDYYNDPMNELEKIYDNTVKYSVTLKSHLFEKDGKYIFNDMLQSPELWVIRNSEKYAIILDSISVDETTNNDIYEATVKFHYSQEPSLI